MSKIVHIIGAADGRTPTPHDGRYVVEWNPHTHAGTLAIDSTDDIRKARRFADGGEAFEEWRTVSSVQAHRPWDELYWLLFPAMVLGAWAFGSLVAMAIQTIR